MSREMTSSKNTSTVLHINLEQFEINTNNGALGIQTPVPSMILKMSVS
jgi:hypothetical protein